MVLAGCAFFLPLITEGALASAWGMSAVAMQASEIAKKPAHTSKRCDLLVSIMPIIFANIIIDVQVASACVPLISMKKHRSTQCLRYAGSSTSIYEFTVLIPCFMGTNPLRIIALDQYFNTCAYF